MSIVRAPRGLNGLGGIWKGGAGSAAVKYGMDEWGGRRGGGERRGKAACIDTDYGLWWGGSESGVAIGHYAPAIVLRINRHRVSEETQPGCCASNDLSHHHTLLQFFVS